MEGGDGAGRMGGKLCKMQITHSYSYTGRETGAVVEWLETTCSCRQSWVSNPGWASRRMETQFTSYL